MYNAAVEVVGRGFEVVEEIASGGMGRVLLAVKREGSFERLYAVKRLRRELADDPEARKMAMDEARVAGLVRHPNVVSVLDIGEDAGGVYLVMDYVDGVPLGDIPRLFSARDELLPVALVLEVGRQVAEGLAAAHELCDHDGQPMDLVHRDVSPQNILVGFDGVARLTDFGIAKALGRYTETTSDVLKGKVGYMSPEQLSFAPTDQRSDLFSLGVVLFELLAARRLYAGKDLAQTARRILSEPVPDLSTLRADIPEGVFELLFDLLAKSPSDRPATAREVVERLDAQRFAVAAEEGPFNLREWMREHFDAARTERHERRRGRLNEIRSQDAPAAAAPAVVVVDEVPAVTEAPSSAFDPRPVPAPPRPRSARWWVIGAALLVVVVTAGGGLWLSSEDDRPPVAEPHPAAAEPPAPLGATAEPRAGEPRVAEPRVAEPRVAEPPAADADGTSSGETAAPPRRPSRPRAKVGDRRPPRPRPVRRPGEVQQLDPNLANW